MRRIRVASRRRREGPAPFHRRHAPRRSAASRAAAAARRSSATRPRERGRLVVVPIAGPRRAWLVLGPCPHRAARDRQLSQVPSAGRRAVPPEPRSRSSTRPTSSPSDTRRSTSSTRSARSSAAPCRSRKAPKTILREVTRDGRRTARIDPRARSARRNTLAVVAALGGEDAADAADLASTTSAA